MPTQQGRPIKIQQAELKTATITVKALTIDKRQVTLAVFRQLQEESLIDIEEAKFNGLPWGRVNYCPDKKACPDREHHHVVWQKGDELRRATVAVPIPERYVWGGEAGWRWLLLAMADGWKYNNHFEYVDGSETIRVSFGEGLPLVECDWPERVYEPEDLSALKFKLREKHSEIRKPDDECEEWQLNTKRRQQEQIRRADEIIAELRAEGSRSDYADELRKAAQEVQSMNDEFGVTVLRPATQIVRCVEEHDGTVVFEFKSNESTQVTRVDADTHLTMLAQLRVKPVPRSEAR